MPQNAPGPKLKQPWFEQDEFQKKGPTEWQEIFLSYFSAQSHYGTAEDRTDYRELFINIPTDVLVLK